MIHGQLDDMVRYGEQAYEHAIEAEMPDAQRLATVHTLSVALDRTGTEMDQAIETNLTVFTGLAAALPGQYFEAHMAVCLLALGRRDQARAHLALALPSLLSTYEAAWHIAACSAADVAAEVGSDEVCGRVYEALLPHRGQYAVLGPLFRGSVRHRLGVLALRLGRLDIAIDDLRRTVEDFDGMPALSWAARARVDLAAALRARGDDEAAVRHLAAARETAQAIGMTRLLPRIAILEKNAGTTWLLRRDG